MFCQTNLQASIGSHVCLWYQSGPEHRLFRLARNTDPVFRQAVRVLPVRSKREKGLQFGKIRKKVEIFYFNTT